MMCTIASTHAPSTANPIIKSNSEPFNTTTHQVAHHKTSPLTCIPPPHNLAPLRRRTYLLTHLLTYLLLPHRILRGDMPATPSKKHFSHTEPPHIDSSASEPFLYDSIECRNQRLVPVSFPQQPRQTYSSACTRCCDLLMLPHRILFLVCACVRVCV